MGATDRRQALAALGGGLLVLVAGSTAALGAPPHPDAELIRLGAQLEAAWAEQRAFFAAHPWTDDDATEAVMKPAQLAARRMLRTRATTWEGLRTKARAVAWCRDDEDMESESGTTDSRLLWSIVHDLLGMKGGAA